MKYFKAIVKLNVGYKDAETFVVVNNLDISKPLSVILENCQKGGWYINKTENSNFKWPIDLISIALNDFWNEFEIVLIGKELTKKEVGELIHEQVLQSNS